MGDSALRVVLCDGEWSTADVVECDVDAGRVHSVLGDHVLVLVGLDARALRGGRVRRGGRREWAQLGSTAAGCEMHYELERGIPRAVRAAPRGLLLLAAAFRSRGPEIEPNTWLPVRCKWGVRAIKP